MDRTEQLLATKRDFLVPCVYHFYRRPPVLVRGEGAYFSTPRAAATSMGSAASPS